ncbi:hypothetical protein BU24DRAFT_421580 [Aaosphaeria arxii CBS 175.79]|uniref:Uncharacterized protein n=1 Tax=Aaosphaeria arxii CBS 175.79 TaxID=1450172 RepID=A0A6A5XQV3_9PLEO|nr:uncharacterized protein BU24DRAFT_421580 [Aaosphaeria arxii CBS 175.79]KAF2015279.1 hypothetical protein BU24DRAFT_421580 [Aaosphaeria arxii CBS 175.79]
MTMSREGITISLPGTGVPEVADNLFSSVSHPPWTEPLDWDSCVSQSWERQIPFHSYARLGSTIPDTPASFPQFNNLPTELQDHILSLCTPGTLFQLLHVSSALRPRASKLFWGNPNAYFHVRASWLCSGTFPGETYDDLTLAPHIRNVEIEYHQNDHMKFFPRGRMDGARVERIHNFWKTLETTFPNVRNVILNQAWESNPPVRTSHGPPLDLKMVVESSPPDIHASAFVVEPNPPSTTLITSLSPSSPQRLRRALHTYNSQTTTWQTIHPHPQNRHATVLLPPKTFTGPIGAYQRIRYLIWRRIACYMALLPLAIEAFERQNFPHGDKPAATVPPLTCPITPNCSATFDAPGQWPLHAASAHPGWRPPWTREAVRAALSPALSHAFQERETSLLGDSGAQTVAKRGMVDEWNGKTGLTREEIEAAWSEQGGEGGDAEWRLRVLPDGTGEVNEYSPLWEVYVTDMERGSGRPDPFL